MTYLGTYTNTVQYKKIEGNIAQELIARYDNISGEINMSIANLHNSNSVYVDLYFSKITNSREISYETQATEYSDSIDFTPREETTEDFYIFKNLEITIGNAIILDPTDIYNYRNDIYSLMIKLNTSDGIVQVSLKEDLKQE
tara:strand:- start:49 stop:474 length:426 start_codon:yes stop_codon:yes gene_type:complete